LAIAPSSGPLVLRFGAFEADLHSGELRKNGVRVRLPEQPFRLLTILLEHPGEMVTREDLQKRLWADGTFVDFEQGLNAAVKRLREALEDPAESPRLIETVPRRGYRFIGPLEARPGRIESLAVLPLENLSGDPEQEYFADGMTEALISSLARIGALRVTSRTTAMHYKGVHRPLREIARELHVDGIVEGTVLRSEDRVRISAQLVDGHSDTHLWAETYDRDLRDVLALQSEVAQAIVREVQVKLTPHDQAHFARARPVNSEAYVDYLKGRYYWNKRTAEGFVKGAQYFQRAIDKDPTYAPAYAGLSDCAGGAGFRGFVYPDAGCGRAKSAARRALEIDETAEAHASLAWAIMHYDFDFLAAEKECQRAIELNPRYATAHQWLAECLFGQGRFSESLAENERAHELDPLSLIINASYASSLSGVGRYEDAIKQARKTLELDPNLLPGHEILGQTYEAEGKLEESIAEYRKANELEPTPSNFAMLACAYAKAGRMAETRKILDKLTAISAQRYVGAYPLAIVHLALGEKEEALRLLEQSFVERDVLLHRCAAEGDLRGARLEANAPRGQRHRAGAARRHHEAIPAFDIRGGVQAQGGNTHNRAHQRRASHAGLHLPRHRRRVLRTCDGRNQSEQDESDYEGGTNEPTIVGHTASFSCGFQDPRRGCALEVTAYLRAAGGTSQFIYVQRDLAPRTLIPQGG